MFTDFNYDSEVAKELADTVSKYLNNNNDFHAHYQSIKNDSINALKHWDTYAELGWLLAPAKEDNDGIGCSSYELACMQIEMGKKLSLEPFISHCLAVKLLEKSEHGHKDTVLPLALTGENILSLAMYEPNCRYSLDDLKTQYELLPDNTYALEGTKVFINDIQGISHLLVLAKDKNSDKKNWFCIPSNSKGLTINQYLSTDDKPMANVTFKVENLDSQSILKIDDVTTETQKLFNLANVLNNADSLGCCIELLSLTSQYLQERKQFNAELSSFQSLQHSIADMFIALQRVISLVFYQAQSVDLESSSEAKIKIDSTTVEVFNNTEFIFEKAIQLHGGIGVTEELSVGHLAKRIIANNCRYGDRLYFLSQLD
jgi:alkylation response protein AidB-like acyl-CoA dehydrogenase